MLILLSPSKTLDFEADLPAPLDKMNFDEPELLARSRILIKELKKYSVQDIAELMKVSEKIADLNYGRYRKFKFPFTAQNARPALLAFKGDVYRGFDFSTYKKADFQFAGKHIRILSGMYGYLRPLELIQPYRLEMGIRLKVETTKNLYEFWDNRVTDVLNRDLKSIKSELILNLASQEYFKVIQRKILSGNVLSPDFREKRNGVYKMISVNAKRARGVMADFLVRNRIKDAESLKQFNEEGYSFNEELSQEGQPVFTREGPLLNGAHMK